MVHICTVIKINSFIRDILHLHVFIRRRLQKSEPFISLFQNSWRLETITRDKNIKYKTCELRESICNFKNCIPLEWHVGESGLRLDKGSYLNLFHSWYQLYKSYKWHFSPSFIFLLLLFIDGKRPDWLLFWKRCGANSTMLPDTGILLQR